MRQCSFSRKTCHTLQLVNHTMCLTFRLVHWSVGLKCSELITSFELLFNFSFYAMFFIAVCGLCERRCVRDIDEFCPLCYVYALLSTFSVRCVVAYCYQCIQ